MPTKDGYFAPLERAYLKVKNPFDEFLHQEATAGLLLIISAITALVIANIGYIETYGDILHTSLSIVFGDFSVEHSLHHWINHGLMTLFFFVVGLEIKREILTGELSTVRQAVLPVVGAIGGMVVPAAIFLLMAGDGDAAQGWGIPMATDIAFAVGILALLGKRVPRPLITFLVALAIVDDLGAVTLIAVYYTETIEMQWLGAAGVVFLMMVACNLFGIRRPLPYFLLTVLMWFAFEGAGIHATVAGILGALTIPSYTRLSPGQLSDVLRDQLDRFDEHRRDNEHLITNQEQSREVWRLHHVLEVGMSPLQRLETLLHVPVSYLVIPLFALANSAVSLKLHVVAAAEHNMAALGVLAGLTIGKLVGVVVPTLIVWKLGLGRMAEGVTVKHLIGVGLLAGIGFTMSIFIAELAYPDNHQQVVYSKVAILVATVICGVAGYLWLRFIAPDAGSSAHAE